MKYKCSRYEFYPQNGDIIRIVAYNPEVAKTLNRLTKRYPKGTQFLEGVEPLFIVPRTQLSSILAAFKRKGIPTPTPADLDAQNLQNVRVSSNVLDLATPKNESLDVLIAARMCGKTITAAEAIVPGAGRFILEDEE